MFLNKLAVQLALAINENFLEESLYENVMNLSRYAFFFMRPDR